MLRTHFVTDSTVESFHLGILLRVSRLDVFYPDAAPVCPALQCCTNVLWPVVAADHARASVPSDDLVKAACDALRWQGEIHIDAQRSPIKIVDHAEQTDTQVKLQRPVNPISPL